MTEKNRDIDHIKSIQRLLDSGLSFALYRLPHSQTVRLVLQKQGEAHRIVAEELEPQGFIFAPFAESTRRPTLLIRPDVNVVGWEKIERISKDLNRHPIHLSSYSIRHRQSDYASAFSLSLAKIKRLEFEKIVLADKFLSSETAHLLGKEAHVFCKAVLGFPNSMVSLVYTPTSGRWMGITPEILLESSHNSFRTMALAGTKMHEEDPWDSKNIAEQQTVSQFFEDTFHRLNIPYRKRGPYTRKAGNLFHICTDFHMSHELQYHTMEMLRILHPTPAICGMPKADAYRFICRHEKADRNYYSGYLGPINMIGGTHIFVNLRCAQIRRSYTIYYAGGGLNHLSNYEKERQEVERKMDILKRLAYD